ncbi:MAG: hypothetical protein J0H27_14265 [Xanthomonadales bacterium]|nr:hypothetical protein [Xanthomonadales bacterium]ODU93073.1 MAG: hypothetical protein ABT18_09930 [Rhodanobacter sp. SCN 66-43]OJY83758.1 MAG: hypothetical protein BGP23_14080 [Xanthomonadales bacterium 66-474]
MTTETKTEYAGHPAKLKEGGWGAHVNSDKVQHGDSVSLTTKAGKTWNAVVDRVVWTGTDSDGNACALCTLVGKDKPATAGGQPAASAGAHDAVASDF